MKKWMFSFALLLSTSIQNNFFEHMIEHDHSVAPQTFSRDESSFVEPYTVQADYLSVRGMEIKGFDSSSMKKMEKAFDVLEKVVNSEEFKERILNFKNNSGERSFASAQGKTNEEIYAQFMEGRERLQQNTPGEMNFYLRLYYKKWSRVVGYTSPSTNVISINWKYFRNYSPNEVAGNLAHEWVHKLGFDHRSASEHDSVPYAIGYIVEEMGERYLKGHEIY